MVVGIGVSVAEECGEEDDLRGRGAFAVVLAFAIKTDAKTPMLLDTAFLRYDD